MTHKEFYAELEGIIETEAGRIRGTENLKDLDGWNSMAVMSFIAMVDRKLGLIIDGTQLEKCKTVQNLAALVAGRVEN
jgi:acyl carrier protein